MRRHLASVSLGLGASALVAALLLTSCGDDTNGGGQLGAGGGGSGGVGAGGLGMSGSSAATAGMDGTGGNTGGSAAGGVAGSGGASAGAGGKGGAGGTGGATGGGGNGGVGGNPVVRVYTIEGCDVPGAGGAGGAGGADGAGGAPEAGGANGVGGGGEGGASGPGPVPNVFASFTVYNFETDKPVQTCVGKVTDFTITITGDAPITVATNIAPGIDPASVVWTYDNVAQGPHNIFPYSLGPDDNGDYMEPTPPLAVGVHTLTITAYDEIDGMGNVLGTATVKVTVIDGA